MNSITKTTKKIAGLLTGLTLVSVVSAMELVMVTSEDSRSVLQTTLALQTDNRWQVSTYDGSDLQMVDDIRQRAVTSTLPSAAQIPGATIRRWAALGFINPLTDSANESGWASRLPQVIQEDISFQNKPFAIPTQIHRSNWMWLNNAILTNDKRTIPAPHSWKSFFELMQKNAQGQLSRIITVDDESQHALILEAVILGLKGPDFYRQTFKEFDYKLLKSQDMIDVFQVLAQLRPYLNQLKADSWEDAAHQLVEGRGDILFAGDWIKPYLVSNDGQLPEQLRCEPFPEASATFLYNLNSVVMFRKTAAQDSQSLAHLLFTENLLTDLNLREGSIPARLDISPWGFDRCAVRAMREFRSAHTINTLQPSLSAGMAAPEPVQKGVYDAINAFMTDPLMTPKDGVRGLAKAIRVALYKI